MGAKRKCGEGLNIYSYRLDPEQFETLRHILSDDAILEIYSEEEAIQSEQSLIIVPDVAVGQELLKRRHLEQIPIWRWDAIESTIMERAWVAYCNAECYYLDFAIKRIEKQETDTVILGSSYAKYGLSARQIGTNCVNLGLDAQDIYYTCELGYRVIEKNPRVRNIVLAAGYYWFFSDISRADTAYARGLITGTYYPILKDVHHAVNLDVSVHEKFLPRELNFLDENRTMIQSCKKLYCQQNGESAKMTKKYAYSPSDGYWKMINRYPRKLLENVPTGEISWYMIPPNAKDAFAVRRCSDHNKLLRHMASYEENKEVLNQFVSFCNRRDIDVYILCMPQTQDYIRHLAPQFREYYYTALDAIEGTYQFLDYHDANVFNHEDYLDQDHLGPKGAEKATMFLKEMLDSNRA